MTRIACLALALAPALAGAGAAGGTLDGEVVAAKGAVLLVRASTANHVVQLEPATTIRGAAGADELAPGERVHVRWSRAAGHVKIADVLEADPPWALGDPLLGMRAADAVQRLFVSPGTPEVLAAVDVRPRARWEEGHLPSARSAPLERLEAELPRTFPDRAAAILLYSEGPRCPRAPEALRVAVRLGYTNVRVLLGGFSGWWRDAHPVAIEPAGLARGIARGERFVVIDVRSPERASSGTVPGALPMSVDAMDTATLGGPQGIPPVVVVGEDGDDPAAFAFADRLRNWRANVVTGADDPPLVLAGGVSAWRAAGRKLGAPAEAFPRLDDPGAGEISRDEFLRLWNGGGRDALLLDVRPVSSGSAARHVPLDRLAAAVGTLPRDREIVAFCSIGKRSRLAYELLKREGFRVRYLRGAPP